jgi:hypothetical protein
MFDMKDVKPSVLNWAIVGLMAVSFIVLAKWIFTKYPVPYISPIVAAV